MKICILIYVDQFFIDKKTCKFSFKSKHNLVIQYNYSFDFKMQMKQSCKHMYIINISRIFTSGYNLSEENTHRTKKITFM